MPENVDSSLIRSIWNALTEAPRKSKLRQEAWRIAGMVEEGWIDSVDFGDLVEDHDYRVRSVKMSALAKALDIPFPFVFRAPRRKTQLDATGFQRVRVADAAAIMIALERLGFQVDPEIMVAAALDAQAGRKLLTQSEFVASVFDRERHRYAPLLLSSGKMQFDTRTRKLKTAAGYRAQYVTDTDGNPLFLEVRAPKYRRKRDATFTKCVDCGMNYMKGNADDGVSHRQFHRKVMAVRAPRSFPKAFEAVAQGWHGRVDASSPKWMHDEVYKRAREFRREQGYDFIQWSHKGERSGDAVGHLYVDADGTLQGAHCFRLVSMQDGTKRWRLDWIWIAPEARRQGRLAAIWPSLRVEFGRFHVERPLSAEMEAFLAKHGDPDDTPE